MLRSDLDQNLKNKELNESSKCGLSKSQSLYWTWLFYTNESFSSQKCYKNMALLGSLP